MGLPREPRVGWQRDGKHCSTDRVNLVRNGSISRYGGRVHDFNDDFESHVAISRITYGVSQVYAEVVRAFECPVHGCQFYVSCRSWTTSGKDFAGVCYDVVCLPCRCVRAGSGVVLVRWEKQGDGVEVVGVQSVSRRGRNWIQRPSNGLGAVNEDI